ncbi:hypothetical protein B0T14DRAFT_99608 [Immersiella caudata]|uniref:Secreted protein n=1 Tax=Immersiella caudata TaxID=314043 RepID=A0AA40C6A9_9PEZI|nr:hypothetical protein B0T14DRAFT_99608 [Immersiella caudata]
MSMALSLWRSPLVAFLLSLRVYHLLREAGGIALDEAQPCEHTTGRNCVTEYGPFQPPRDPSPTRPCRMLSITRKTPTKRDTSTLASIWRSWKRPQSVKLVVVGIEDPDGKAK